MTTLISLIVFLTLPFETAAADVPAPVTVSVLRSTEAMDRGVDQAALESQRKAARSIVALLKKYRGKYQEPLLLLRLVDSYQQMAAIQFRVGGGKPGLADYNQTLNSMVSNLTEIMVRFPRHDEMSHVLYLRGNALEELGKKSLAIKDYTDLISRFAGTEDAIRGCMALADIAIADNQHERAIGYLKRVEQAPDDPHYPFALYKMSWSYYNLKDISLALRYSERTVGYYDSRRSASNEALRENALLDTAVFYLEGFERKIMPFGIEHALGYFKGLEKGPVLGRMLLRFAKLLRSHGHDADLIAWKDQVLQSESERPETFDVLIVAFEHQLNHQRYKELLKSSQDMVILSKNKISRESLLKGQKLLLDTAEGMQKLIVKNKNATEEVLALSVVLASVYDSFIQIIEETDPRVVRAHYNLAETLFQIKQYEKATTHYRWVVKHAADDAILKDASLKAIGSRYEHLIAQKMIPGDLVAKAMAEDDSELPQGLMHEWIGWVDEHVSDHGTIADNFLFEANRSLYQAGVIRKATGRMSEFALKHAASRFALPSATLAVDTYVASSDWEGLHDLISKLERVKQWKGTDFAKRLHTLDAGALYKLAEADFKSGNSGKSLSRAEDFLKTESNDDFLALAAKAAKSLQDYPRAESYFSRLIAKDVKSPMGAAALLSRAGLFEERFQFAASAADYKAWLELPGTIVKIDAKERDKLRSRALMLAWLGGKAEQMKIFLKSSALCAEHNEAECDRFEGLLGFLGDRKGITAADTEKYLGKARKGFEDNRPIWAALSLEGVETLSFRDRNQALKTLAKGLNDLDPLVKSSLIASFTRTIPEIFKLNRKALSAMSPLAASERHITHRVDLVREYEGAATLAAKLPYAGLQAKVLNEVAWVYLDFAQGLRALAAPKGMAENELEEYKKTLDKIIIPFEEKAADMRERAFEVAFKSKIERQDLDLISEAFFQENPSQAKALRSQRSVASKDPSFDISLLRQIDSEGPWFITADMSCSDATVKCLKAHWWRAIEGRIWSQAIYLTQQLESRMMRGMTLVRMGAQAEGLAELGEGK